MRVLFEWNFNPEGRIYNHLLVVNCLKLTLVKFFYTIAFMQWFTEFMELFLSVWELIKTLNLCFVCFSEHKPGQLVPGGPTSQSPGRSAMSTSASHHRVTNSHAVLGHPAAALEAWLWVSCAPSAPS